jgi:hypothetical protein
MRPQDRGAAGGGIAGDGVMSAAGLSLMVGILSASRIVGKAGLASRPIHSAQWTG